MYFTIHGLSQLSLVFSSSTVIDNIGKTVTTARNKTMLLLHFIISMSVINPSDVIKNYYKRIVSANLSVINPSDVIKNYYKRIVSANLSVINPSDVIKNYYKRIVSNASNVIDTSHKRTNLLLTTTYYSLLPSHNITGLEFSLICGLNTQHLLVICRLMYFLSHHILNSVH